MFAAVLPHHRTQTDFSLSPQNLHNICFSVASSSENCLSTSAVKVPGKLGSPWEYSRQTSDADRAFASLARAVEDTSEVTMKTIDAKGYYILAEFPSKVWRGRG